MVIQWQVPTLYQQEAAILQADKVCTPTHIVVPGDDVRVPSAGNFLLERALTVLGIPTKLIILPGEPHIIGNNPWHEKIKPREELKWLQKYGNSSLSACDRTSSSATYNERMNIYTFLLIYSIK